MKKKNINIPTAAPKAMSSNILTATPFSLRFTPFSFQVKSRVSKTDISNHTCTDIKQDGVNTKCSTMNAYRMVCLRQDTSTNEISVKRLANFEITEKA